MIPLSDIDSLVLKCRDERSKSYIKEAVACLYTGAYRGAIVVTWTAVVYDVLHKLRELELGGDAAAKALYDRFEKARSNGDLSASLSFERDLLSNIMQLELLSSIEVEDMQRLQSDRNRCAHPSMSSEEDAYQPPPELARTHIVNALRHLLLQPPVQGKAALARIAADIDSEAFPQDRDRAQELLQAGLLKRPRDALVRNLIRVLAKGLLVDADWAKNHGRRRSALVAVWRMHPALTEEELSTKLPTICHAIVEKDFLRVLFFVALVPGSHALLGDEMRLRLHGYIRQSTGVTLRELATAVESKELVDLARNRISLLDSSAMHALGEVHFNHQKHFIDRALALYARVSNFKEANDFYSKVLKHCAHCIDDSRRKRVVAIGAANSQIRDSHTYVELLRGVVGSTEEEKAELVSLLAGAGLSDLSHEIAKAPVLDIPF